jgi:aminoglycoside phosphotransferase (APT) family kinase protein
MGFPAPRVIVTESDPSVLGGPFMVMTRVSGQTLVHGIEGLGADTSLVGQLQLLFNLPAVLARIIDQWADMQIRLHQLPAETLLRAVAEVGSRTMSSVMNDSKGIGRNGEGLPIVGATVISTRSARMW